MLWVLLGIFIMEIRKIIPELSVEVFIVWNYVSSAIGKTSSVTYTASEISWIPNLAAV